MLNEKTENIDKKVKQKFLNEHGIRCFKDHEYCPYEYSNYYYYIIGPKEFLEWLAPGQVLTLVKEADLNNSLIAKKDRETVNAIESREYFENYDLLYDAYAQYEREHTLSEKIKSFVDNLFDKSKEKDKNRTAPASEGHGDGGAH